jgi:hypothetical protein
MARLGDDECGPSARGDSESFGWFGWFGSYLTTAGGER